MRHAGRVLGQGFGVAQAHGAGDELQCVHEAHTRLQATAQLKSDHPAHLPHLLLGQRVLRKAGQAGVVHGGGSRVGGDELGHLLSALAVAIHAQRQRFQAAHHQVGVLC